MATRSKPGRSPSRDASMLSRSGTRGVTSGNATSAGSGCARARASAVTSRAAYFSCAPVRDKKGARGGVHKEDEEGPQGQEARRRRAPRAGRACMMTRSATSK